ncbi:ArsR/SmtB family transcription factor [Kyrpidia tusciae]|uniref:Transcriptional regulator, ArsR family n=1 Tax=Kyrpidia tusciae (strain DSM 2912 / NBRC 15312 / T2) TaxID=562970 RepID=D5WQS0_KYRT2|nr:metalloregulator ArsR/SmtB family transcription factor [Kyrpidia tusciae]ADG06679.1 transcriptional regulator, ArsR family [Kyrpidia tusciae DSM 2912]
MDIRELADVFKVLGDPTRLQILTLLNVRDCCVCELVPLFGISQPAVSKHLARLRTVRLVTETRRGQWVFYSINRERLKEVVAAIDPLPGLSGPLKELANRGPAPMCSAEPATGTPAAGTPTAVIKGEVR